MGLKEAFKPGDRILWFHCASLGEFEQGRPIIEAVKEKYPSKVMREVSEKEKTSYQKSLALWQAMAEYEGPVYLRSSRVAMPQSALQRSLQAWWAIAGSASAAGRCPMYSRNGVLQAFAQASPSRTPPTVSSAPRERRFMSKRLPKIRLPSILRNPLSPLMF